MIQNYNTKDIMLNREFGLIQFYNRILNKSIDPQTPLLEKLSYLCIVSKNCDELFEVRIARLLKWAQEVPTKILPDGLTVVEALHLAQTEAAKLYDKVYQVYQETLLPQLNAANIQIINSKKLTIKQKKWVYDYFIKELKPVLTPIGIDPSHPFPRVPNKNLHFAVELEGADQFGRNSKIAIVEAPRSLKRVIQIPKELSKDCDSFILLQDIIKLHVDEFFYGLKVHGCYPFRVTRGADITLKTNTKNLRFAVTQEIHKRKYARCTRLELDISAGKPNKKVIDILINQFNLTSQDLYLAPGPVNLSRLFEIYKMVQRPDLCYPKFTPGLPKELIYEPNIFAAIEKNDILLHTPYQSFHPIVELSKLAAFDPDVLAIKMTVYRTGSDSEIVQNLIRAAKAGKQVVASVELFARFDEEANVELANALEDAGAHVVYGVMGYKVHAKMLLIIRKDGDGIKQYAHIGTGNYHQASAKAYTDFGLLTTNPAITQDIDNIFSQITGFGRAGVLTTLYQSPFTLYDMIIKSIETEIANAKAGKKAHIMAKMNSLIEPSVINALYLASQAGVKINLIVRSACALKPGIKGLSENIEVKAIVGRFLEHHRVFYFYNDGTEDLYISSADWMKRNFFKRVEACLPILNPEIKKRIIEEGFKIYLKDNQESWIMHSDGTYKRFVSRNKPLSAQKYLMEKLGTMGENNV